MNFDQPSPPEKLNRPHIRLEFFRHDAKDTPATAGPRPNDNVVRITAEGRVHATEVGKTKNPMPEVAISIGSPRQRSQETALRHMLANEDSITPDMSLEDIRAEVEKNLNVGKKDLAIPNLDFNMDGTPVYHDTFFKRYLETKDALVFLWKESDSLLKQSKDIESDSYSTFAGKVAELVAKYLKVLPRWKQIVDQDPLKKYEKYDNELQRFFGSHQNVLEPFLMKVIQKTGGDKELEGFIDSLPDKNGFSLSEGFSVVIEEEENGQLIIRLRFKNKEYILDEEIIQEIIKEKDDLKKEIADSKIVNNVELQ